MSAPVEVEDERIYENIPFDQKPCSARMTNGQEVRTSRPLPDPNNLPLPQRSQCRFSKVIETAKSHPRFTVIAVANVLLVLGLFSAVVVLASKSRTGHDKEIRVNVPICREYFCQESATELSKIMSPKVDPCEDFYEYACGSWSDVYPANNTVTVTSPMSLMQRKLTRNLADILGSMKYVLVKNVTDTHDVAAFIYQSCLEDAVNDNQEQAIKFSVDDLPWGILNQRGHVDNFGDVMKRQAEIVKLFGVRAFFGIDIIPNPLEKNNFSLALTKSSVFSFRPQSSIPTNVSYADSDTLKKTLKSVVCFLYPRCSLLENLDSDINKIVVFDRKMQDLEPADYSTFKPDSIRKMKVKLFELNDQIPLGIGTDWVKIVDILLVKDRRNEIGVPKVTEIYEILAEIPALKQLFQVLMSDDPRTVYNWLVWKVYENVLPKMSKYIRDDLSRLSVSSPKMSDADRCAEEVNYLMPYTTVDIYDKYYWHFREGKRTMVKKMINEVKTQMFVMINETKRLNAATKKLITNKLIKADAFVGFPEWIKDGGKLEEYYQIKNMFKSNVTYQVCRTQLVNLKWYQDVKNLGTELVRSEYWSNPNLLMVNAWYNPLLNTFTIPIGILDYPFMADIEQPRSVMFGRLAHTITHEIFHAFDPIGLLFDGEGHLNTVDFDKNTTKGYNDTLECLVNQYNAEGSKGAQTITEDFPDNAAMEVIFKAYLRTSLFHDDILPDLDLENKKQLFVYYATNWCLAATPGYLQTIASNVHSLGKYRVLVPLKNSEEFAQVFKCPVGSTMNPRQKCRVF